ncbi:MAG: hypothetical protein ACREID_07740, partial [Planctomycetota bacterium]
MRRLASLPLLLAALAGAQEDSWEERFLAAVRGDLERARGLLSAVHEALPDAGPVPARWLE